MDELGFVKLYRKVKANPIWKQCSPAVWKVFCACLLDANWKERKWFDGISTITLPPGSLVTSLNSLCEDANVTRQQARDALAWLLKLEITTQRRTHRHTIVTFTNWLVYQSNEGSENTAKNTVRTQSEHSENTVGTLPKERKKGKKVRTQEESQNHSPSPMGETANGSSHKAQVDALFTEFWSHVWRRVGRPEARRAFPRALKYLCDRDHVKAPDATKSLIEFAKAEPGKAAVEGNEYRLALHPSTWLNNHRWEDEITEVHLHRGVQKPDHPDFLPNY